MTPEAVERSLRDIREHMMSQLQECLSEDPDEDMADTVDMLASELQAEVDKLVEEGDSLTDLDRFDLVEQITDVSAEAASLQERVDAWKRRGRSAPIGSSSASTRTPAPPPPQLSLGAPAASWPPQSTAASSSSSWPPPAAGAGVGDFGGWPPPPSSTFTPAPSQQSRGGQEALSELRAASRPPIDSKRLQAAIDKCHRAGMFSPEVSAAEDMVREEKRKQNQQVTQQELEKAIDECDTPRLRRAMAAGKQVGLPAAALQEGDERLKQLDAAKRLRKDACSLSHRTCFLSWKEVTDEGKFKKDAEKHLEQHIQHGSGSDAVLGAALAAKEAGSEEAVWQKGFDVAAQRCSAHDQAVCAFVSDELHDLEAAADANTRAGGPRSDAQRLQSAVAKAKKETIITKAMGALPCGATKIDVPSHEGFALGDTILVGGIEERTIVAFGSLVLDRPLEQSHPSGVEIRKLKKQATLPPTLLQSTQTQSKRPMKKIVFESAPATGHVDDEQPVIRIPQRGQAPVQAGSFGSAPPSQGPPASAYSSAGAYGTPPPQPQYQQPMPQQQYQQPMPQQYGQWPPVQQQNPGYWPPPQRPQMQQGYGQPPPGQYGMPPPDPRQSQGYFGDWFSSGSTRGMPQQPQYGQPQWGQYPPSGGAPPRRDNSCW